MELSDSQIELFLNSCANMIPIAAGCCIDTASRFLSTVDGKIVGEHAQIVGVCLALSSAVFWNVNMVLAYVSGSLENLELLVRSSNVPIVPFTYDDYREYVNGNLVKLFERVLYKLSHVSPFFLGENYMINGELSRRFVDFIMKYSSSSIGILNDIVSKIPVGSIEVEHDQRRIMSRKFSLEYVNKKSIIFFFKSLKRCSSNIQYVIVQSRLNNTVKSLLLRTLIEGEPELIKILSRSSVSSDIERSLNYLISSFEKAIVLGKDVESIVRKNEALAREIQEKDKVIKTLEEKLKDLEQHVQRRKSEIISKLYQEKDLKIVIERGFLFKRREEVIIKAPVYILALIQSIARSNNGRVPIDMLKIFEKYGIVRVLRGHT